MFRRNTSVWAMVAALVVGCGGEPRPLTVRGTITLDGQPLAEGMIYFVDPSGTAPDGGEFRDGAFTFTARPGNKRVEIRAYRRLDPPPPPPLDPRENVLPARYNAASELTAEVVAGANNVFDFALTSR